jgi:cystathionine beta-lyase
MIVMKYNFDEIIDRTQTESYKWNSDALKEMFGEDGILPFWVADMDFKVAEPIIEALRKRVEHGIYGYSFRPDSYYQAIINWTKRRFGWEIEKEWIEYTPGIVPAVNYLVQALLRPGDKVLIQEPVYYPFKKSVENNGCHVIVNELKYNGDFYEIDFQDFEEKVKDTKVKVFILCSPHNPVSRVWTEEELRKMGDICLANDVMVISDEIHNDLVYSGNKHIMFGSLSEELADISITCTAPSKTFNLAGMQASNVIISNKEVMTKYREQLERNNIGMQNPLSIVAAEAAYNEGEEWLEQLLRYLEGNIDFIKKYLAENLPKARLIKPQATYLGWIDLREYESDGKKLEELVIKEGKVAFDGGTWFGQGGDGFLRINYACPRALLEEGLKRLSKAVSSKYI